MDMKPIFTQIPI